uniref:F-box domain-containing protein n=1 Tax=Macrostomum lignano TaxID=282301 RepID=A0A1I8J0V3_9PLAT
LRLCGCNSALSAASLSCLLSDCPRLSLLETDSDEAFDEWRHFQVRQPFVELVGRLSALYLPFIEALELLDNLAECPRLSVLSMGLSASRGGHCELPRVLSIAPNLTELRVEICGGNFDLRTDQPPAPVPRLKHLSLDWNWSYGENTKIALWLLPSLPSLESLDLGFSEVSDEQFRQILRCLTAGLADLRVEIHGSRCSFGAELGGPLPPGLQQLQLTGSLFDDPWSLQLLQAGTDDLLAALLSRLPRLRCLCINNCSLLTRQAWANLRSLAAWPLDLMEFRALDCTGFSLTDEAVADLCVSPVARGLRWLHLSDCSQLTAVALASIASGCPWLTELQLEGFRR